MNKTNGNTWASGFGRLWRNKASMAGLGLFLFICLACILLPDRLKWNYFEPVFSDSLKLPGPEHIFGTNVLGRDMLSGVLYGGRNTLRIAASATFFAAVTGSVLGLVTGYFSGRTDFIISRLVDLVSSIPVILLALAVEYALGWGKGRFGYAIAISAAPQFVRLVRASVQSIMGREYIEAARALGVGHFGIIRRHVLRNIATPVIIHLTNCFSEAILTCTILGYLVIGINPPTPEWGALVYRGKEYIFTKTYLTVFPALAIMACIISLNFFSNGLRDALDPRESA